MFDLTCSGSKGTDINIRKPPTPFGFSARRASLHIVQMLYWGNQKWAMLFTRNRNLCFHVHITRFAVVVNIAVDLASLRYKVFWPHPSRLHSAFFPAGRASCTVLAKLCRVLLKHSVFWANNPRYRQ
jgi:hypothetical protein